MVWVVVFVAVVLTSCGSAWCGFALARMVYGYPVGRGLVQRAIRRRDEHRFLPGDVRDLDEAFRLVIRSHQAE